MEYYKKTIYNLRSCPNRKGHHYKTNFEFSLYNFYKWYIIKNNL